MSTARPPKPAPGTKFETVVETQLGRARQRIRWLDAGAAVLGLLVAGLAYGIIISILDSWLWLPTWFRQTAFVVFGLVVVAYIAGAVLPPLIRRVNPYYAAQQVERTIPDAKNSVVNWLDLKGQTLPPAIRGAVSQKAARDISQADLEQAISGRRASWLGGITAGLVVALAVLFFIAGPQQFRSLMGHAFLPFSSTAALSTRTTLELIQPEGGNVTVPAYHAVNFQVHVEGKIPRASSPDAIRLLYRYDRNGRYEDIPFEPGDTNREWVAMIAGSDIHNGFWYKVTGGDYESPEYQVRVRSVPLLAGFQVHYHFPAYLRQPDMESTSPNLRGPRGADVTLVARANCAVRGGTVEVLGQKQPLTGQPVDSKRALRFQLRLEQSGRYRIHFTSQEGDTNPDSRPYTITVLNDLPPQVRITQPDKAEIHLPLNGVLRVEGQATDDFGLTGLRLQMQVSGEPTRTVPYRPGKSWRRPDGSYPVTLDYADVIDLARLKLKNGQALQKGMVIDYWLEATDNCAYPPPGPNVGRSQPTYRVILDPPQSPEAARQQRQAAEQQKQQKQQAHDQKLSKSTDQPKSNNADKASKPDQSEANGQKNDADQQSPKQEPNKPSRKNNSSGQSGNGTGQQGNDQGAQEQGDSRSQNADGTSGNNVDKQSPGSKSGQKSANQSGEQQSGAHEQNGSGTGGQGAKNDLQERIKRAQEWLDKHKQNQGSGGPNQNQPQSKGDTSSANGSEKPQNGAQPARTDKPSPGDRQDTPGGKNQQSAKSPPMSSGQSGSHTGQDDKPNQQDHDANQDRQRPSTQAKGSENNPQAAGNEHGHEQQSGAGKTPNQPMNRNDNQGGAGHEDRQGQPSKSQGAEPQQPNSDNQGATSGAGEPQKGTGSKSKPQGASANRQHDADKASAGTSGSSHEPGKKQDGTSAADQNGTASKPDHKNSEPGKGNAAESSSEPGHKSGKTSASGNSHDKPKGNQPGNTGTPGQNQSDKTQDQSTQPKAGSPSGQDAEHGNHAAQQSGHNAPDKGPTSQSANQKSGQSKGQHSAVTGGQRDAQAAEQKRLEHDLSEAMKQLQQKDDQELGDLMKKLQSQDSSTRKQAGRQLEDKISQAAQDPQVRKQAQDLLKRLQKLNQENQSAAPGTANANGTKGERGPTGHEGSRHQAGNSSSQSGDESTAGQQQGGSQAGKAQEPSPGKSGQGSSHANAGAQGNAEPGSNTGQPSKGNGSQPGSSGKGAAGHEDNRSPQQPGDNTGPGPGDGTRANGNRTGSGVGHFKPGDADPANRNFQKQSGDLQLQEFPKNPPKNLLQDLHLTAKDWEALRKAQAEMIRQRRQQTSRDTMPARGNGGRGLNDLGAHQIKSGTQEKDIGFRGATHPPPGFSDTYREFTQKGSKAAEGK